VPVSVQGLRDLNRGLLRAGVDVEDLKDVYAEIAKVGAYVASNFAPRDSGALAATIRGNRAKGKAVVTAGKARTPYAGAINYGWPRRGISANPFLQKADKVLETRAPEIFEAGLDDLMKKNGLI
jgi:hypothetical protein